MIILCKNVPLVKQHNSLITRYITMDLRHSIIKGLHSTCIKLLSYLIKLESCQEIHFSCFILNLFHKLDEKLFPELSVRSLILIYIIPESERSIIKIATHNGAMTHDFQQCGILTSVDSDKPVQPPFILRNFKCCSVSSLTVKEYSRD